MSWLEHGDTGFKLLDDEGFPTYTSIEQVCILWVIATVVCYYIFLSNFFFFFWYLQEIVTCCLSIKLTQNLHTALGSNKKRNQQKNNLSELIVTTGGFRVSFTHKNCSWSLDKKTCFFLLYTGTCYVLILFIFLQSSPLFSFNNFTIGIIL